MRLSEKLKIASLPWKWESSILAIIGRLDSRSSREWEYFGQLHYRLRPEFGRLKRHHVAEPSYCTDQPAVRRITEFCS